MASEAAAKLEGRSVGAYRVARLLGAGAMGKVYLIEHARLPNTLAALKVLDPRRGDATEVRERFVQEAMVAAAIGGERVARPLDIGQLDDGTPYIIMEYVAGRTLAEVLADAGPLPTATALTIAYRVADTIALAHARGIVHRDLKPSNIMLTDAERARVKVLDFGVARATGDIKLAETRESTVIGSPGYMSPEAATGASVDERTDVFSLAVTLFKLLTNALPFAGENAQAIVAAMVTQPPRRVQALRPSTLDAAPPEIDVLLARALDKDAALRPSMAELRDALAVVLRDLAPPELDALLDEPPPSSPSLPREIDPLAATVAGVDSATMRAAVERFAAARVATAGRLPSRMFSLVVGVVIGVVVVVAALIIIAQVMIRPRMRAERQTPAREVVPSVRQLTTTGDIRAMGFAPDGKSLAWVAGGAVNLLDVDSERTRVVTRGDDIRDTDFSSDGKMLYYAVQAADGRRLYRMPRDGGPSLELPGFHGVEPAFAPDGQHAAVIDKHTIIITDGEGQQQRQIQLGAARFMLWTVRWSPDSRRLLAVSGLNDKTVTLLTADGKEQAELPPLHSVEIQWYDDRTLIFTRRAGLDASDLLIQPLTADGMHADGEARLVAARQLGVEGLMCARGCRSAVFMSSTESPNVWTFDVDAAGAPHPRRLELGTTRLCAARLSPDGRRVVLGVNTGDRVDVMLMPVSGGERRHVGWAQSCTLQPNWAPDDARLAWRSGDDLDVLDLQSGRVRVVSFADAAPETWYGWLDAGHISYFDRGFTHQRIVDVESGVSAPYDGKAPATAMHSILSPDGTRVALYDDRGLRVIGTDGTPRQIVADAAAELMPVGWSHDGAFLFVEKLRAVEAAHTIWRIPVGGGALVRWLTLAQADPAFCSFSRDGATGLCDETKLTRDVWLIQNLGALVDAARAR